MGGGETFFISGDDQISTGSDGRIVGEIEADAVADFPSGEIDCLCSTVEELDILSIAMIGGRIVHNFIDDD